LELAVPPGRDDEVGPDEDVSGKQHAEDKLEEEYELFEGLSIGGGDEGGNGGNMILNVGPLLPPIDGEAFNVSMTDSTLAIPLRSIPLAVIFVVPMVITPIVLVISLGRRL
jgi:hypothetical protein